MSKSILVIDTPESCLECPCCCTNIITFTPIGEEKLIRFLCGANNREILEKINTDRQDWCPLKEVNGI